MSRPSVCRLRHLPSPYHTDARGRYWRLAGRSTEHCSLATTPSKASTMEEGYAEKKAAESIEGLCSAIVHFGPSAKVMAEGQGLAGDLHAWVGIPLCGI